MAYLSILRITTKRDADGNADVLRNVAGVAARDIPAFLGVGAALVGAALDRTPTEARNLIDFDLGDEVECQPIALGGAVATTEFRAFARTVAVAIAAQLADLARSAA